jgi:hypothetical protein
MKNKHEKLKVVGVAASLLALVVLLILLMQARNPTLDDARSEVATPRDAEVGKIQVKIKAESPKPEPEVSPPEPEEAPQADSPANPENKPSGKPRGRQDLIGQAFAIVGDYRSHLGFDQYVRQLEARGGVFYLFDRVTKDLRAEVDLQAQCFNPVTVENLRGMSPRIREIEKEPVVRKMLEQARDEYGSGLYSIILLLPARLDDAIHAGIHEALERSGIDPDQVNQVRGVYEGGRGSPLSFRATELYLNDGRSVVVNFAMSI